MFGFYHRQLKEAVTREYLKEEIKTARHALLGRYFYGEFSRYPQPLQFENKETNKEKKVVFNLRKLSELPFQESYGELWSKLEYTLTDLDFLEAKCASGMTYDLVNDFKVAVDSLPERQEEKRIERTHQRRILMYTQDLIAFARGENKSLEVPPSVEIWSDQEINDETERIKSNPTRLDRISAFFQFVNSESYTLVKSASIPGFCLQQAYNSASSGPVGDTAKELAENKKEKVLLLKPDFERQEYNSQPALSMTLEGHGDSVAAVCCTPDGKLAISASHDRTLRVWNIESGMPKKTLTGHKSKVNSVCCTPDGRLAISASEDGTLKVWDVENGECKKTLKNDANETNGFISVTDVCCVPNGRLAVSASDNLCVESRPNEELKWSYVRDGGTLRVWNLESGECTKTLIGHTKRVTGVCCSADGKLVISASVDKTLRVWDLESGVCEKILKNDTGEIFSVCCTPEGKLAISASHDKTLRVWDLQTGECKKTLIGHTESVKGVCCTPDGKLAISASDDGTLRVWNIESGECRKILTLVKNDMLESVCCTADGKLAFTGNFGSHSNLSVWNIQSGICQKTPTGHEWGISEICCTPDGRLVISSGEEDCAVRVWDLKSGICKKILTGHTGWLNDVCCTPDGRLAISASDDETLRVWNIESGICKKTLKGHIYQINRVCCTPDGKLAISASNDGTLRVWNIESGECRKILTDHMECVREVCCTPDGKLAISTSSDNSLRVWDLESGICKKILQGHTDAVLRVCCTPDGKLAISTSSDNSLRVWDLESGICKKILQGHTDAVLRVCCTPDGKLAISTSSDNSLRVWDLESGICKKILQGHTNAVLRVCCTPDGKLAISTSEDATVRVWDIESGKCFAVYHARSSTSALSVRPSGHIVHGESFGDVVFTTLSNFPLEPPLLTPVRLWLFENNGRMGHWNDGIIATCIWCGHSFPLNQRVITKTNSRRLFHEQQDTTSSLDLPTNCPICNKPVRFNSFIVDNKNRD